MTRLIAIAAIAGLGLGGIYGMVAMGYTLIMAASGVFNFIQGTIVMGGALVMLWLWQMLGWPVLGVLAIVLGGGALLGIISYLAAVLPVSRRLGPAHLTEGTLVTTFGLGLALNSVVALTFGYNTVPVKSYVSDSPWNIAGIPIRPIYVAVLAITLVIVIAMEVFLLRTKTGLVLRATVQDADGARLSGIPIMKVVLWSFAIGGTFAAVAGLLMVPVTQASSNLASQLALYGFAGMAIGGYGSFKGAFVGGLVVGLASTIPPIWVNPTLVSTIIYGLMLVILLARPRGLFGTAGAFGSARLRDV
jgi:branched-chain amino acid transport system permease protein